MKCDIKHCKQEGVLIYYGYQVCEKHWHLHCSEDSDFDLIDEFDFKQELKTND